MATIQPDHYQCAMCGCILDHDQQNEDSARIEAEINGFDINECAMVCDDCYKLTPWGQHANRH